MFMRQKRNSFELRHTDHIRSVQIAAQSELARADVFTHRSRDH